MKRFSSIRRQITKNVIATTMCFAMLFSLAGTGNVVHATEVTGATTETTVVGTSATTDTTNIDANGTLGKNSDVGIEVTNSITGKAGKSVTVDFKLMATDTNKIRLKSVYPVIDTAFPFETSGDTYKIVSAGDDVEKQKVLEASYKMTARSDLETGYHSVRFIGEYQRVADDGTTTDYYVIKTINIYFTGTSTVSNSTNSDSNKTSNSDDDDDDSSSYDDEDDDDDDDSYSGGSSYYSGGSSSDDSDDEATAPKLIITGCKTEPEKIMAGETFKLTISVQNTSKTTSVCNGKFLIGNEAGNFLPTSGSNAVYVESIPAGKTGDIEIELKAGADLSQKNYVLVVKGDFDDGKGNNFTSSDNLTLQVYQEAKFAISEVSMSPEVLGVGSEGTLMFTINNKSNVGVYNMNITVEDEAVKAQECYVGNVAGSSSAYATLYLTGLQDNSDVGTINIVLNYEDSEGNVSTSQQTVECMISEEGDVYAEDEFEDLEGYDEEYEEEEYGFEIPFWVYIIIGVVAVAVIIVVIVIMVKRKKKRLAKLLEEDDDDDDEEDEEHDADKENDDKVDLNGGLIDVLAASTENREDDLDNENF